MSQYTVLIYEDEAQYATATPEVLGEIMQAHDEFAAQGRGARRQDPRRRRPAAHADGDERAARRLGGHRRPVRRDQGGARRLLPHRRPRPRRRARRSARPARRRFGGVEVRPVMSFD